MISIFFVNVLITAEDKSSAIWSNTIDGQIVEWFNNGFNGAMNPIGSNIILIVLSLLLATLFSGCIGFQREINGHAAGFRTHILIGLGSSLIMILSVYGLSNGATRDPMRFAAAGVTGIGFLGAGSIIQNGFNVKGLTTAASIWVTMAIGMCCGEGYFVIASLTTVIAILCLTTFSKFELLASKKNSNVMIVVKDDVPVLSKILDISEKMNITIKDISSSMVRKDGNNYVRVVFKIACLEKEKINNYLSQVSIACEPIEVKILH